MLPHADILNTLFQTPMAVALLIALLLDNTLPGSKEERGLHHWNLKGGYRAMTKEAHWSYDLPFGLSPKVCTSCFLARAAAMSSAACMPH